MVVIYVWGVGVGVVYFAAVKVGVLLLIRMLVVEWGSKYGICINVIVLGLIEWIGGVEKLFELEKVMFCIMNSVLFGWLGILEEIVVLAVFLLFDEVVYINGDCIIMDGG